MRGRTKLLKTSYRTGKENISLALKFLQNDDSLLDEVNNFYKNEEDKELSFNALESESSVEFLEGSYRSIVRTVQNLLKDGYKYNDILLICRTKKLCEKIADSFPGKIIDNIVFIKEANDKQLRTKLLNSTYHSSKGLESKIVILVGVDEFTSQINKKKEIMEKKLLYVGMTRASEKLFIHASSFDDDSFAKDIKDIYGSSFNFA